jgi:hypothetical protein
VTLRSVGLGSGLVVDVPVGWSLAGAAAVNRGTERLLLAANVDIATLPTVSGNGDIDAAALSSAQVTVEIESFCRLACMGPTDETRLPLDWSTASSLYERALPSGHHEVAVGFRWFDLSRYLVARWVDDAAPSDIAAIAEIARSVRPERAVPATGEFNGWAAVGALADIAVGSVRFVPLPDGAIRQQRIQDDTPFFVVRGKQNLYAFISRPLYDQACEIRFDPATDRLVCAIEGRTYEWTRFGRYLGHGPPQNDLSQHRIIVRDGLVWVLYTRDSLISPIDEAAER